MPQPALRRFWVVLSILAIVVIALPVLAELLAGPVSPDALRYFGADTIALGRRFSREVQVVAGLRSLLLVLLLLWLCFSRAGARLLHRLEALAGGRTWLAVLAVVLGMTLLVRLVALPFSFHLGYLHEHAYGLSRATPAVWFGDWLKSSLVSLITTALTYLPLYWLIRRWPRAWWAPGGALALLGLAFSMLIYPVVVQPLYNPIVPVRDPKVLAMVQSLASRAGVRVETTREMLVSAKTTRVNAEVTGLGATKQVLVYDTLLQGFPPDEVEAVLAHELGHAVRRDVANGVLMGAVGVTAVLLVAAWLLRAMTGAPPLRSPAPHSPRAIALLLVFFTLTAWATAPVQNSISRYVEARADRFALALTHKPRAFAGAMVRLAGGNPDDVEPPALVEWLDYDHPSIMNRLRMAESFPPTG